MVKEIRRGEKRIEAPEWGDVSDEIAEGIEEIDLPLWKDTEQFMLRAMCLVLLSAFLERTLRDLVSNFSSQEASKFKPAPGKGDVESLLIHLKEKCNLDFKEPESSKIARDRFKSMRNEFAHGRWNDIRIGIANYPLVTAFRAVSELIEAIDKSSENHA